MSRNTVLVIGGPTASGKSGLALGVAARIPAVIVNADSMQLYDGLPLLTAQPSDEDKAKCPHALYAALAPSDACSAARWRGLALAEIDRAHAAGKTPVLAGGTGFYLKALMEGLSPVPDVPPEFRARAAALQKELGNPAFNAALKKRDPETAAKLDPLNTQRNVRAWEVLEATGRPLAEWQKLPPVPPPAHLRFISVTLLPPREELMRRCDARFDAMMQAGALEEVAAFRHKDTPLSGALGYGDLAEHLAGRKSLADAVAAAKLATRHYAKRQTTWFRNQVAADLALAAPDADAVVTLAGI